MKHYLLIETQSAFEAAGAPEFFGLARDLQTQGSKVEILLVQNGVMPARVGAKADGLSATLNAGVRVWADEFSLRERAFAQGDLVAGVKPVAIGMVIDRMADGWNILWH